MILLLALLVSLAVALLRGGKLQLLAGTPFRYGWLALGAFGLQIVNIYFPSPQATGWWDLRTMLLVASYGLLIIVGVVNVRLPGMPLIMLGLAANFAVMLANGGFMPVTLEALQRAGLSHMVLGSGAGSRVMASKDIILSRESTHLWFLSDIVVLTWPIRTVMSPGDICLMLGGLVFFQCAMFGQGVGAVSRSPQQ